MQHVEAQKPAPVVGRACSAWISLFARRLVFASLLTLAVLGSYLVTREANYSAGVSPEAVMAQQESPAFDTGPAQDNMLVTLTAYEQ